MESKRGSWVKKAVDGEGVIGFYNENGYELVLVRGGQVIEQLYFAGNNKHDSSPAQSVEPGSPNAVPVEKIKEYAEQTGEEVAEDRKIKWLGVEQVSQI